MTGTGDEKGMYTLRAAEDWRREREINDIMDFMEACLEPDPESRGLFAKDVYNVFQRWWKVNKGEHVPTQHMMSRILTGTYYRYFSSRGWSRFAGCKLTDSVHSLLEDGESLDSLVRTVRPYRSATVVDDQNGSYRSQ